MKYNRLLISGFCLCAGLYYIYSNKLLFQSLIGDSDAQVKLGEMYLVGETVPQDYDKAINLFQKAAAQNNSVALLNLGGMYGLWQGVPEDIEKAKQYFRKSCNNGLQDGCVLLEKITDYQTLKNGLNQILQFQLVQ